MSRVLVVEDYPPLAKVMAIALERVLPHEVVRVGSVVRARAQLGQVLAASVDIDLPDGDGVELARELLAQGAARVVFYTACRDPERLAAALELGPVVDKVDGVERLVVVLQAALEEVLALAVGAEGVPPSPRSGSGTRRKLR